MKQTPLVRKTPMKRGAFKPRRKVRDNEFSPKVKAAVRQRSGGMCEARTAACVGRAVLFHHRLRRSQGGPGTAENALHCCDPCHVWTHAHPKQAYELGLLTRSPS